MRVLSALPLLLLFALPLFLSLALVLPDMAGWHGFQALARHPQFTGALGLTLFTGLASTALSLLAALAIIAHRSMMPAVRTGAFLAVPHLAFAIGLGFLIMPAGLLARALAPLMGWLSPPAWITTQDPYGFALLIALVLKETPFLVWALAAVLNREDVRLSLAGQSAVAASLGHRPSSIFLRVVLPQILPRIFWPLVAVLAYGLTVVDMALVIGPAQPPTLAQLIWTDLNDADPAANARGAAGVMTLSALILFIIAVAAAGLNLARPAMRSFLTSGPAAVPHIERRHRALPSPWVAISVIYAAVVATLMLQSLAGLWPFPDLMPQRFSLAAWQRMAENPSPLIASLMLAVSTAALALLACVAWLEQVPPLRDTFMLWLSAFALCLPALVIGLGQYRLFLALGITGTALAMFFAHVLPVAGYVFIMLHGPYRGFEDRYRAAAAGLGAPRGRFLTRVKWPLLKAPLLSAFAVGFAVSIAQYVPAQLASAGRFSTLPMEAVTLSSGGNRALTAAYGLALMALPLLVFAGAAWLGRPRWALR